VLSQKLPWNSRIRHCLEFKDVTSFERYMKIERLLSEFSFTRTLLDVGSGGASPLRETKHRVLSIDVRRKNGLDVIADVKHLPFQHDVFDVVIAADLLEHLKIEERKEAINEMKRVGTSVIIHTPLQDGRNFMGAWGDMMFYKFTKDVLGRPEKNTEEHLKCVHPSPTELRDFDLEIIDADWNLTVWFTVMKLHYFSRGLLSPIVNTMYFLLLSKIRCPPWWGAWVVYSSEHKKKFYPDLSGLQASSSTKIRFEQTKRVTVGFDHMNVLVISPRNVFNLDNGAARRIYHLSDNLARYGNEVTIFCIIPWSNHSKTSKLLGETKNKAKIIVVPFVQLLFLPLIMLRYCIQADIIQMEFPTFAPLMLLLRLLGKPIVLDEHGVEAYFIKELSKALEKPLSKAQYIKTFFLEWLAVKLSTVIFACSTQDAKKLQAKYKIPCNKIVIVPNGVDDDFFNYVTPYSYDKPTAIFVGNFDHAPNVYAAKIIVNKIAASAHKEKEDFFFVLVGRDPPQWLNKRENKNYVRVFANVKDVRPFIDGADVAIAPIYHGSGTRIKILEYMALSKPVVSTSKGAEGLDAENGKHILLRNRPEEFAEAIIELLSNRKLATQIGKNGHKLAMEKYLWKDIVRKVIKVHEELLD
jgi:glycosyltransferase involved in cell wall biosynthesis/2-polyprenyl-3-methyl-5-hydroxy-6-metoxy-1,4-benzoquinol methylase